LKKGIGIVSILFGFLLWSFVPTDVSASEKSERLRQTMADLSLLNSQLLERKTEAESIRADLSVKLMEIKKEARKEIHSARIRNKTEALQHPRILYDLMLMAEIQAYMDRYKKKIGYYRVACDRIGYLYQRADDDLKIVNTLSGMKVEALVSQASQLNKTYLKEAQTIVIKPDLIVIEPPERIWEDLVTR
jgi:hypothetical protein